MKEELLRSRKATNTKGLLMLEELMAGKELYA